MLDQNDVKFFKLAVGTERIKKESPNEIVLFKYCFKNR